MQNELTCNQFIALMNFYVEDKINSKLKKYIDEHLKQCPRCREAYMQSKKIVNHVLNLGNETDEAQFITKQYEDFKDNISAYIDNELTENESLRMKKIAISNPLARKKLIEINKMRQMLHSSFDKGKQELKIDYSKLILNKMYDLENDKYSFNKILAGFGIIFAILFIGFLVTLYS